MKAISLIAGIIIIVALVFGGLYAYNHVVAPSASDTDEHAEVSATTSPTLADVTLEGSTGITTTIISPTMVTYTDSGFAPATLSLNVGDTVTFVNNSTHGMWVAADAHPTHTEYDGTSKDQHCANGVDTNGSFDECSPASPGKSYSFTFTKAGTFEYHNHVAAKDVGTIVVK